MKQIARIAWLVSLAGVAAHAQDTPDRAAAFPSRAPQLHRSRRRGGYYPKPFAQSATKTTFNGFEAVKTGNIYILFTKAARRRRTS
jgi:hypothetical protein